MPVVFQVRRLDAARCRLPTAEEENEQGVFTSPDTSNLLKPAVVMERQNLKTLRI
jgi:hypothetical protein